MKFIKPNVEWWPQENERGHIAKVGRICYKSKGKQPGEDLQGEELEKFIAERDEKLCKALWESGHRSMYRHATRYFFVSKPKALPFWLVRIAGASPYIGYAKKGPYVWLSTNMHYLNEHPRVNELLSPWVVDEETYIKTALESKCMNAIMLLRMTLVVTTQRIQGESYNRKSPNCIAEQSTRYVNLDKKGGVQICRPHWEQTAKWYQRWASHFGYWVAEKVYQYLIWTGLKPEDARGNLTFNTYTICAYTYSLHEWRHIMDMRLRNLTGIAHKDAQIVAELIADIIDGRMQKLVPDFKI